MAVMISEDRVRVKDEIGHNPRLWAEYEKATGEVFLRGQTIPNTDPVIWDEIYQKTHKYYRQIIQAERYKEKVKQTLLDQGYTHLVSVIDPKDIESYRECGAKIGYSKDTDYPIAYMPLVADCWLDECRLCFYQNYENLPMTRIENKVLIKRNISEIPGKKDIVEFEVDGYIASNRMSKLQAIHTFATDDVSMIIC